MLRRPRSRAIVLLAVAFGACGDVPTDPWAAYDVAGRWAGSIVDGAFDGFMVFDLQTRGHAVTGQATVDRTPYAVVGRTNYPTVYLRLTTSGDTLTFLGEAVSPRRLRGSLLFDRVPPRDVDVRLDRR